MDIEHITKELNKKFAAPLQEYYKRRIVFWYDPDKEFADDVENLSLDNARVLVLTGRNNFSAKLELHREADSNYLVYCPLVYANIEDNWLLDIELYSEDFRADVVSLWMDDLHIPNEENLRKHVQKNKNSLTPRNVAINLLPWFPMFPHPSKSTWASWQCLQVAKRQHCRRLLKLSCVEI